MRRVAITFSHGAAKKTHGKSPMRLFIVPAYRGGKVRTSYFMFLLSAFAYIMNIFYEVNYLVAVAPLVVIPCNQLVECAV